MLRYFLVALFPMIANAQDAAATIKTAEYAVGMIRGPQRIDAINTRFDNSQSRDFVH